MSWLSLLADQRLWFVLLGASAMFVWHNHAMRGLELDLAEERERKQQVVIEYREREAADNGANTAEYLEALDDARKEIDSIRSDLADGRIKLRLCQADSIRAAVSADNSRALEEQARSYQRRLEDAALRVTEKAKQTDAWVQSAHEWINRK